MFGYGAYDVFIIAGFLGVQYFFSTRNSLYWGGVLPVIFVVWRTWIFFTSDERFISYVLVLLLGLAFLIGGWTKGRRTLAERRKKELNKMKSQDRGTVRKMRIYNAKPISPTIPPVLTTLRKFQGS